MPKASRTETIRSGSEAGVSSESIRDLVGAGAGMGRARGSISVGIAGSRTGRDVEYHL